jgi:hypothetical protein
MGLENFAGQTGGRYLQDNYPLLAQALIDKKFAAIGYNRSHLS